MTSAQILEIVASETGLTVADIKGDSRLPSVSDARQLAMLALREHTNLSLPGIARVLNRTHSTVMHGIDRARRAVATNPETYAKVKRWIA